MKSSGHLISWIGNHDLEGISKPTSQGPLKKCIEDLKPDKITLLYNFKKNEVEAYFNWLQSATDATINLIYIELDNPTDYEKIYLSVRQVLEKIKQEPRPLLYNITSGTPAMTAIWILLAKTTFPGTIYHTHQETGTTKINFPFELTADYLPAFETTKTGLQNLLEGLDPASVAFEEIIHEDIKMKQVIARARRLAQHDVPVLIQGETGTGKELFARAIHDESPRRDKKFFAINCGAIPLELVESQFFGYKKGTFTGATNDTAGIFENTNGGTVFLDEIGELPLASQVKLLRALQEGEITRLGDNTTIKINVRIISATHKNLIEKSAKGEFRSDLFYRLAVGTLVLPPLRERKNDLVLLAKEALRKINLTNKDLPLWKEKQLSSEAIDIIKAHSWPGNVRELVNTLQRATIWAINPIISSEDLQNALISVPQIETSESFGELHDGFSIRKKTDDLHRHFVTLALEKSAGNLKAAAELLGEKNYQNVANWRDKYLK